MIDNQEITDSSGNAVADLEFEDPEEEMAKARLTALIGTIIQRRGLSHGDAASVLQMEPPELSALLEGEFGENSPGRLFRLLTALDHNVEIAVTPRVPSQARASTVVHADSEPAMIGNR